MICFTFENWLAREKVHWSRQALQLEAEVHVRKVVWSCLQVPEAQGRIHASLPAIVDVGWWRSARWQPVEPDLYISRPLLIGQLHSREIESRRVEIPWLCLE